MAYQTANPLTENVDLDRDGVLTAYWIALLRVVTGWWFFHAGLTKLIEDGLAYGYAPVYLQGMEGTVLGPIAVPMGTHLGWAIQAIVPLGETLIGLALILGVAVRLAATVGATFMTMFWVGNADFARGMVNGDLLGLLVFVTLVVLAAGRYYGLDAWLEDTEYVENRPRLKYLLG